MNYTVTNSYGFYVIENVETGQSIVSVAMPMDSGIYFHMIHKFDDYQTASLTTLAMHRGGVTPDDFVREDEPDAEEAAEEEGQLVRGELAATEASR